MTVWFPTCCTKLLDLAGRACRRARRPVRCHRRRAETCELENLSY
jgi:hypothetical protein